MANKLNPELVQNIAELTNVKKISDLPIIDVIEKDNETEKIRTSQQFNNSYLLSSTLLEDNSQVGGRYFNYRVKLNEVTDYLSTLSDENMSAFRQTFDFFVDSLKNNTKNSYVEFIPANDTIDTENTINNYSYTFKYNLSEVHDEVIGFSYSYIEGIGEQVSTYSYTNVLTEGLVTNVTLEKYVRNSIATILGVPNTPTALSEAIDSVIEFVDWFKGYVRSDTDYGSLHQLISTIEAKDSAVLNEAKSYTIENKELSYAYTETSYNLLYSTIQNIDVDVPVKGVSTTNKITIGNITYILNLDDNKNLQLSVDVDNYSRITLSNVTSNVTKYVEYKSSTAAGQMTLSATTSKPCQATQWNAIDPATVTNQSNTTSSGKVTYTASGNYGAIYNGTGTKSYSWTINATELLTADDIAHGHETAQDAGTKTVSMTYSFSQYAYWTSISATKTTDLNSLTLNKGAISSNGYPAKVYFSSSNWGSGAYIYFLIKGTGSHTFVMGSDTADGTMPGGVIKVGNYTKYDDVPYTLYRSDAIQTGNCNVKIS